MKYKRQSERRRANMKDYSGRQERHDFPGISSSNVKQYKPRERPTNVHTGDAYDESFHCEYDETYLSSGLDDDEDEPDGEKKKNPRERATKQHNAFLLHRLDIEHAFAASETQWRGGCTVWSTVEKHLCGAPSLFRYVTLVRVHILVHNLCSHPAQLCLQFLHTCFSTSESLCTIMYTLTACSSLSTHP